MPRPDVATIHALRSDIALQVARHFRRSGISQSAAAKQLDIPQPTLSKIVNGHVADLSIELLLRVAVRAGLPVTLMTGRVPEEAGAFRSNTDPSSHEVLAALNMLTSESTPVIPARVGGAGHQYLTAAAS